MSTLKVSSLQDLSGNSKVVVGGFYKADPTTVAFTKTGAGTAEVNAGTIVGFADGTQVTYATATTITMPTLTAGTDYAIWADKDGSIQATTNFTSPPETGSRKIGGFHYASGGHSGAPGGGNTTPQINAYSFWDLKWRPNCGDVRGQTLIAGGFWSDIYLTGVDHLTNGTSKFGVTIADGSSPAKIPTAFGGSGSSAYGSYNWWEASEVLFSHGKRLPTYMEYCALAYGTTEAVSCGTDPGTTSWNAAYVSKWGVVQATGTMDVWGADLGGPYAASGWVATPGTRGSTYNLPNAVLFGGYWGATSSSGSRLSYWGLAPSISFGSVGSRGVCNHLQID